MRSKLATLAIVALGVGPPLGLVACGGDERTVTQSPVQTATTPGTQTMVDCCSGPGGGYAGCSMQTPPDCQ
jgi:hypothetical protein